MTRPPRDPETYARYNRAYLAAEGRRARRGRIILPLALAALLLYAVVVGQWLWSLSSS